MYHNGQVLRARCTEHVSSSVCSVSSVWEMGRGNFFLLLFFLRVAGFFFFFFLKVAGYFLNFLNLFFLKS